MQQVRSDSAASSSGIKTTDNPKPDSSNGGKAALTKAATKSAASNGTKSAVRTSALSFW